MEWKDQSSVDVVYVCCCLKTVSIDLIQLYIDLYNRTPCYIMTCLSIFCFNRMSISSKKKYIKKLEIFQTMKLE
jgi:branched-subunit amino acid transport protein AzlD